MALPVPDGVPWLLQLSDLVALVRGSLSRMQRAALSALIVIEVHAKDVVHKLVQDSQGEQVPPGASILHDAQHMPDSILASAGWSCILSVQLLGSFASGRRFPDSPGHRPLCCSVLGFRNT